MDDNYSWGMDENKPMTIVIKKDGRRLFSIYVGEVMESVGRKEIMKHVRECDRTPWLKKWHDDAMEEVVEILSSSK